MSSQVKQALIVVLVVVVIMILCNCGTIETAQNFGPLVPVLTGQ